MENIPDVPIHSVPQQDSTPVQQVRPQDDWKKGGRLLSGLVGSNVLLFGSALLTCVFSEGVGVYETDFLICLTVIMAICILWMFFQLYFSWKHKNAVLFKDCQAGPIWMRGGIILFGIGALIMTSLKIAYTAEYRDCVTPAKVIQPVMEALFIIVQTCFLWVSCKHCVQMYMNATRCLLMVLLTLNLIIWILAVTEESKYHTVELQKYFEKNHSVENNSTPNEDRDVSVHIGFTVSVLLTEEAEHREIPDIEGSLPQDENANRCGCKYKCAFDETVFIYLYPFNIEYNLFAAAMIYIMWKNVGRQIDENASYHHGLGPGVRQHIPLLGLISGLATLIVGLVMFIMYEVGRENIFRHWISITTFYIFHIIALTLMCLANLMGIIIFRLDKRTMDNQKNPSRTLDMVLLLGATLGQYGISYYSIIAMVSTQPFDILCGLTLIYSVLMIVQHSLQNVFIIEGLHRLPPINLLLAHLEKNPSEPLNYDSERHETLENNDSIKSLRTTGGSSRRMSRRETLTQHIRSHLKKRKTMKDVYLFLFLCNIIFWIMPAFGARIRFDTGLEVHFYGFSLWAIITNICLPFGIFYRMHAAASLLELYSMA